MPKPLPNASLSRWLLLAAPLLLLTSEGLAFDAFWTAGNGVWTTDNNWDTLAVPDEFFEDVAIINNGGVATLGTAAPDAAGLVLGQGDGQSGTLIVQPGGSLNLVATNGAAAETPPIGVANIGIDGAGTLQVQSGGSFSTTSLDVNPGGTVEIGGGAGVASVVSTDSMYLNGVTITRGPGHTFNAEGFVNFEGNSQYIVDLQAPTHTTLISTGPINNVQGALTIQTSGGYMPASGETWDLLRGSSINGGGFLLDTSLAGTPTGYRYRTQVNSGLIGQVLELVYEAAATLQVDTDTGNASLVSESGESISMVGYTIRSPNGRINPANWNSLADQGESGWEEAGGTTTSLSELNAENSLSIGGVPFGLGSAVYTPPTSFGEAPDISFQYGVDGGASLVDGIVKLTGSAAVNNLLLTIDPTTGEGQLTNSSPFTIDIVAYSIQSEGGSLDAGNWDSLDSQAVAGWDAGSIASDEFALSEFVPENPASTLAPGQSYSLGEIFQVGGEQDVSLEFGLSISGLSGDFNGDGRVDAADYTAWRDNLGDADESAINNNGDGGGITNSDYTVWSTSFGAVGGVSGTLVVRQGVVQYGPIAAAAGSALIPEPTAGLLAIIGLAAIAPRRLRIPRRWHG